MNGLWLLVHATAALLVLLGFAASKPAFQTARPLDRLIPLWLFLALLAHRPKAADAKPPAKHNRHGVSPRALERKFLFCRRRVLRVLACRQAAVFLLAMGLELLGGIGNYFRFLPLAEGSFLWIAVSAFALLNSFAFCPSLLALWRCKVRPKP